MQILSHVKKFATGEHRARGGLLEGVPGGPGSKIDEKTGSKKREKTINEPYKKGCYWQYNG